MLVTMSGFAFESLAAGTFRSKPLSNKTLEPERTEINGKVMDLKDLAGEPRTGYAVVQGGCSDGVYAYYLMVKNTTQMGRVLKVRIKDNAVVKVSSILNIYHGNGMTYDSRRKLLVVTSKGSRRQELTMIDAGTLQITRQENVKYTYFKDAEKGLTPERQDFGLSAIAYNSYYDCYIALARKTHDLIVFDPDDLQATAYIQTAISSAYPGTYQAMDADDQYVYLLLSPYGNSQKKNRILALDWNSENLKPVSSGSVKFIAEPWKCKNDKSGKQDAVITVKTPFEAENIYHVAGSGGKSHFYLSAYDDDPVYKWVKKKVKYKVKWKKVKKRVKWKRVKRKGKWKWKYKKIKVWKYKTKRKTVRVKVIRYLNRHSYVYDLGTF